MDINNIIQQTVDETIIQLKINGLITNTNKTAFQKCEELLRSYDSLKEANTAKANDLINEIDRALMHIQQDPYYEVIVMYYIEGVSREAIANSYNTTGTTISRNKRRLINKLKMILFADDSISELLH